MESIRDAGKVAEKVLSCLIFGVCWACLLALACMAFLLRAESVLDQLEELGRYVNL